MCIYTIFLSQTSQFTVLSEEGEENESLLEQHKARGNKKELKRVRDNQVPTEEEMEVYRKKRRRSDDPMTQFIK